ncbi:MAG: hypothetical protein AAGB19_09315 [Cyanobacteria bacterium P01_F01_bin.3]
MDEELKQALFVATGVGGLRTISFPSIKGGGMVLEFTNTRDMLLFVGLINKKKCECVVFNDVLVSVAVKR